jgi:molybdate transport system ATP-binding protein
LLLDEAFSALDPGLRAELGDEVRALALSMDLPTIVVTHDGNEARRFGGNAVALREGRVVSAGALE